MSYDNEDGILGGGGGGNFARLELAVSHQNPDIVYAGIDGNAASYLKVSYDGGVVWNQLNNDDNTTDEVLYPQGWFDITITVTPVNTAISSSISLLRSPKPGSLTAAILILSRIKLSETTRLGMIS